MTDLISRADAIEAVASITMSIHLSDVICDKLLALPSADAVPIHNDGTLEVKVPNAQKVGRVLVMDTDSHIGGGLFYPESADRPHGEWYQIKDHKIMGEGYLWHCSICDYKVYQDSSKDYPTENYCPNCGARMKGGAE